MEYVGDIFSMMYFHTDMRALLMFEKEHDMFAQRDSITDL